MTINLKNFLYPKVKASKMGDFQELKHINGLLRPESGNIWVDNILLNELEEALNRDGLKYNYADRNNNTEQSTLQ